MTELHATAHLAEPSGSNLAMSVLGLPLRAAALKRLALGALVATIVAAPVAQAQQPAMTTVTLLTQDKGLVDARPVAVKDIVAYVTSQHAARSGLKMITLATCPKVPPDMIQGMMQDLQKLRFVVVLDLKEPNALLCAR